MERTVGTRSWRDARHPEGVRVAVAALAALAAALAAALLLHALVSTSGSPATTGQAPVVPTTASLSGLRTLPLAAQAVISRTVGAGDPAFRITRRSGRITAGGMQALFARGAMSLTAPGGRLTITPSPSAAPTARYAAGPLGIEQSFTITRSAQSARLNIPLTLTGTVLAKLAQGVVTFTNHAQPVFRYGDLEARDATGRRLHAWFTLRQSRLVIHVAAKRARYPIRIDPFTETAEPTAPASTAGAGFGDAVAVSGSTIVVGAPGTTVNNVDGQGAAYVFTEPQGGWGAGATPVELTEPSSTTEDRFGISVAISGSTLVVGANRGDGGAGAAWVYTEPAGGWSGTIGTPAELTASDGSDGDGFGFVVATDGSTVVVGAQRELPSTNFSQPVVYVFSEGAGWTTQAGDTELVTGTTSSGLAGNGLVVSGSTVIAGVYTANSSKGEVLVFQNWTTSMTNTPTQTLTAPDAAAYDDLGWSLALNGSTLVAGAPQQGSTGPGKLYVWTEPAGGWSATPATPATLTATGGVEGDDLGTAVGIETTVSPETIVAAAPGTTVNGNLHQGTLDVFTEPTGGWSGAVSAGQELTASDGAAGDLLGAEVKPDGAIVGAGAVAIDGGTIVAGSAEHASQAGAAYVFTNPTATTTTTTTGATTTTTTGTTTTTTTGTTTTTTTGTTTTTTTGTTPAPTATLSAIKGTATGATDKVTCHGPADKVCAVTEQLVVTERFNAKGKLVAITAAAKKKKKKATKAKTKTVVLASRSVVVHAGRTATVTLKLSRTGSTLLKKRHKLSVKLTASLSRHTFATRKLTLKPAKKKKKKKKK